MLGGLEGWRVGCLEDWKVGGAKKLRLAAVIYDTILNVGGEKSVRPSGAAKVRVWFRLDGRAALCAAA